MFLGYLYVDKGTALEKMTEEYAKIVTAIKLLRENYECESAHTFNKGQ